MNEFPPQSDFNYSNQHSDIIRDDAFMLHGTDDTQPMPVVKSDETRRYSAPSHYDENRTDRLPRIRTEALPDAERTMPINFNELRRALGMSAAKHGVGISVRQQQHEAATILTSRSMHIDGRTPGEVPTRDARDEARQNPSKFVQTVNKQQR